MLRALLIAYEGYCYVHLLATRRVASLGKKNNIIIFKSRRKYFLWVCRR